jgi:5'(3')-deoxyribonucleotidase
MPSRLQIAIDMDGVVADWNLHVANLFVSSLCREEWLRYQDQRGHNPLDFDRAIKKGIIAAGVDFWSSIPATSERFKNIPSPSALYHQACLIAGEENVYFLTAVGKEAAAYAAHGKVLWLRKYLGQDFTEFFLCRARNKAKLAAPGRVLMDDDQKNIAAWKASGGSPYLFSCPSLNEGEMAVEKMWSDVANMGID